MEVTIKYFGMLVEAVGHGEENVTIEKKIYTSQLIKQLCEKYECLNEMTYQVAVNQEVLLDDETLKGGDEVALLPPFAGG